MSEQDKIAALQERLRKHKLYEVLDSVEDIKTFMSLHVYAVWDYMSIVKSLQTIVSPPIIPWQRSKMPKACQAINAIVLSEESDLNMKGLPASHLDIYIEAMKAIKLSPIKAISNINLLCSSDDIFKTINTLFKNHRLSNFISFTFKLVQEGKPHKLASSLYFGRENLIPDLFTNIVSNISSSNKTVGPFLYYLNRHIELDGDQHSQMALNLLEELCGNNATKWKEAYTIAIRSLEARIDLWDLILEKVLLSKIRTGTT